MRQAGTITIQQDAERFASYLLTLGIGSKVEPAGSEWAIWIRDENQVDRSRTELDQFRTQPNDERYRAAEREAKVARREAAEKQRQLQKNYVDLRNDWNSPWRRGPVTMSLIVASIAATFLSFEIRDVLMFSLGDVKHGEVWRLVTPIILHADVLHLLFNMWWLYDLGTMIERRLGRWRYALLVLVIALASNFGQYLAVGPNFVGMSGVVYGLFGYAWVRGRLDPTCGLYLQPNVAFLMMLWFVICIASPSMNVANWAHGVGLATGALLGYLPHLGRQLRG